jgi:tRNA nucleotidyltransferase (CCA-adding enzyme)
MNKETKIYLVGGAVRDELLGLEPQDLDYVVINGDEKDFFNSGFIKLGNSFPVFLDPDTKNQFAFARKEKKVAVGYHGFEFVTKGVTIEEDLYRRDLTINAMAKDENNNLFDPFGGLTDLKNKLLKHVSPHFAEDPLRVLRVARFQSRYSDFTIDPETMELMKYL